MLYNKLETIAENGKSQTYKWRKRSRAQGRWLEDFL
jgi:hypothetical protein